jgi:hypothetical protein
VKRNVVLALALSVFAIAILLFGMGAFDTTTAIASGLGRPAMTEFSLQALHDEIEADPLGIGYKEQDGSWKGDAEIVALINAQNYVVDAAQIEMEAVRASVTYSAYNSLAIDEQEWLRWMTPNSGYFVVTSDMKAQLTGRSLAADGVAGSGNDSNSFWAASDRGAMCAAMLTLIEQPGSRAEVLWGEGFTVSISHVAYASNL